MLKFAQPNDFQAVVSFLAAANLCTSDLPAGLPHFFLLFENDELTATAGVEIFEKIALLRSVAVAENQRGMGLGQQISAAALAHARAQGVAELWLITNTAESFFEKMGFQKMLRAQAPAEISGLAQFTSLCPSSAAVMRLPL